MLGLARETSRPFAIDTSFEVYENTRLVLVRVTVVTACCIISIFLIFSVCQILVWSETLSALVGTLLSALKFGA